jgi:hypothetical protein
MCRYSILKYYEFIYPFHNDKAVAYFLCIVETLPDNIHLVSFRTDHKRIQNRVLEQ